MLVTKKHADIAVNNLPSQHRKPKIEALVRSVVEPLEDAETAILQLLTDRTLETSVGEQMDVIGRVVKQPRNNLSDYEYRFRLKTRVLINSSGGTREELINILVYAMLPLTGTIIINNEFPAALSVKLFDFPLTDLLHKEFYRFMRQATVAGVRVVFISAVDVEDEMLYCPRYVTLGSAVLGIGSQLAESTDSRKDDFPPSGTLILDQGTSVEETLNYTSIIHPYFNLVTPCQFNHTTGYTIVLVDNIGKGLGDSGFPLVGGKLATGTV